MRGRPLPLAGLVALLLGPLAASAQALTVSPPYVVARAPDRAASFEVQNRGAEPLDVTVRVRFGFPVWDERGQKRVVYPLAGARDPRAATAGLRLYPRRFRLSPGAGQVVRLLLHRPPGRVAPERWGRVIVQGVATRPRRSAHASRPSRPATVWRINVPLLDRAPSARTGVRVERLRAAAGGGATRLDLALRPLGSAAYLGRVTLTLEGAARDVPRTVSGFLALYRPSTVRLRVRPALPPGRYTARLLLETRRDDLDPTVPLPAPSVSLAVPITVPEAPPAARP